MDKRIEKLDYKKMLRDILKLVDTDFCMDMEMKLGYRKSGSKEMIDVRKYTQEEARIMAEKLARVYRISHGVYCSACNWKYRIENQKQPEEAPVDKLFRLTEELHKQGCKDLERELVKDLRGEPEKQEEWSVRLGTILNDNCIDILDEDGAELKEDLEKFISQLLSERTREARREGREEGHKLVSLGNDKWASPPTVIMYGKRKANNSEMLFRAKLISDNQELLDKIRKYIDGEISKLLKEEE
jgi:hypothetical protein